MDGRTEHCPMCGEAREFEQPPCIDGHTADGGDCPEWICVDCGTAFLLGDLVAVTSVRVHRAA